MKKGFTLVELVGVVVLLAALLLIIVPTVDKILKDGKDEMYENQITSIKQSMATWVLDNKPGNGEVIYITLSQLKKDSLVELDIKNPKTDEFLANDMKLKITNNDGIIEYEVLDDTGNCMKDYLSSPKIDIQGSVVEYVEINTNYNDVMAIAKDKDGNLLNNVTKEGSVDTTKLGSYHITYHADKNGYCNSSIKTVIVKDTTKPVISFNGDLVINYSEVSSESLNDKLTADVTVTDNSNEDITVTVETDFSAIKGNYTIKYIAKDSSGNIATKLRKVTLY